MRSQEKISVDATLASTVQPELGIVASLKPKKKKAGKKYRLLKELTAEQVEIVNPHLNLGLDDWKVVRGKGDGEKKAPQDMAAFWVFWKVFPRKDIVGAALREWKKLQPDIETFEKILADVRKRVTSYDWTKNDGRYIPYAHTYLAGLRWLDEGVAAGVQRRTVL